MDAAIDAWARAALAAPARDLRAALADRDAPAPRAAAWAFKALCYAAWNTEPALARPCAERVSQLLATSRFIVDGVTVDSSAARVSGSLAVGAQVEVSGALRAGVLVASEVQARSEQARSFELNGSPSGLDVLRKRFVLRGTTVSYARGDVVFDGGNAASLVGYTGELKVEGLLSADRTLVEATRIRFKNR